MSCLFESLLRAAPFAEYSGDAHALRLDLVQFVAQHAFVYKDHIQYQYNGSTVEEYCRKMSRRCTMGDYFMVVAFTQLFRCNVLIEMHTGHKHLVESPCLRATPPPAVCCIKWQPGHYFI